MVADRSEDRGAWAWTRVGLSSRGAPFSVEHVCAAAISGVGVDGAAATLMAGATAWEPLCSTDETAGGLQERQFAFGEGPSVEAFRLGGPVLVLDVDAPDTLARWPIFAAETSAGGVGALFALPMQVGAIRLGVLSLYRVEPGPLDSGQVAGALAFAGAACMLLLADADADAETEVARSGAADLTWHRDGRDAHQIQVHQATGMILVQLGVSAEVALVRLRAYAYANNRPLGDVARDVVERRLRFDSEPAVSSSWPRHSSNSPTPSSTTSTSSSSCTR